VEAILSCLRCIVAMLWCSRKWSACGGGLERVPNFGNLRGDRARESLSPAWIGRTQSPNCQRVSTFREESLTKRRDPVRSRQPGQGRHLSECPGVRRNRGADPGAAATRTGARGGTKRGEESHPTRSQSVNPERKKGLKPGLAQGPDCLESGKARFLPGFSTKC
jgi:hypothetical protein